MRSNANLAAMTDEQLLSGTNAEKQDRILMFLRENAIANKALDEKVNSFMNKTTERLENQDAKINEMENNTNKMMTQFQKELNELKNKQENEKLMAEYHSRKYSLIVHNIREDDGVAWESNIISIEKVKKFFSDIGVQNAERIRLANAHRIGQRKKMTKKETNIDGEEVIVESWYARPLIVKFQEMPELESVERHLSGLKQYNKGKPKFERVFVNKDLPQKFLAQRKALVDVFRAARKRGERAKWVVDKKNAEYVLYVNNEKHTT